MSSELSSEDLLSLSDLAQRDWGRGRKALSFLSRTISTDFARAVSNEFPWFANPPCWKPGLNAMERVFGFGLSHHHLFHADPLDWLQMTEPQATAGLAWFLNAENRTVRNGRIRTMLRALDRNGIDSNGDIRDANATNEAPTTKGRRIDLLLTWQNASGDRCGAVIEAKFDHGITRGQLKAYQKHLKEIDRGGSGKPMLFVVSPRRSDKIEKKWRWISWRSLLLAFDRTLAHEHDEDAFRQFRRTLWDRAAP